MGIEWIKEVAVPGGTVAGASAGSGTVAVVSAGSELVIGGEGGKLANAGVGGYFGSELKFAGYDFIIIQGKASRPVYLWIHNDKIEIRDADHIWGKGTEESEGQRRRHVGLHAPHRLQHEQRHQEDLSPLL